MLNLQRTYQGLRGDGKHVSSMELAKLVLTLHEDCGSDLD